MFVFSKNSVKDLISIITVRDSFNPELERSQKCHEEWVEELSIYHSVAEATHHESEKLNNQGQNSPVDELV